MCDPCAGVKIKRYISYNLEQTQTWELLATKIINKHSLTRILPRQIKSN